MPKSLDVLIGLSVIMLALSMAVTMLTQCVTTVFNSRGRHLKRGLAKLLGQIDPALKEQVGDTIAHAVLTHPMVSARGRSLGEVVHREEFTKLLWQLAEDPSSLSESARGALQQALRNNGIADPKATLAKVRAAALQLEASSPQLASNVRQGMAILQEAQSDFVGKLNGWFDQTIDRVSEAFTTEARLITFAGGLLLALALQVDTINLVNRLSADDALRAAFVTSAVSIQNEGQATTPAMEKQYLAFLADKGVIAVADSFGHWWTRWGGVNVLGVLVTSLLLSLGAPFWYSALGKLLQLRSTIARKDDAQRASRQQDDSSGPKPGGSSSSKLEARS